MGFSMRTSSRAGPLRATGVPLRGELLGRRRRGARDAPGERVDGRTAANVNLPGGLNYSPITFLLGPVMGFPAPGACMTGPLR